MATCLLWLVDNDEVAKNQLATLMVDTVQCYEHP